MENKKLQKLSRKQLLELMLEQSKRVDELEQELESARAEIEKRRNIVMEAGSIAEAALRLNNVFEAAQQAADQYMESIRQMAENTDSNRGSLR